jgi:hypothetical protein
MALSGKIKTIVNTDWYLQLDWSATQNTTAKTSTVTAILYWGGTYAVRSTATKTCAIQYNGGTWNTASGAYLASINDGEKKEIHRITFTIQHNTTTGEGSFSLDGYFDVEVTLSGTYYGRVDLAQTTFTLNTIEVSGKMWVKHSGDWDKGVAWVKVAGVWKKSKTVWVKVAGVWKKDDTT